MCIFNDKIPSIVFIASRDLIWVNRVSTGYRNFPKNGLLIPWNPKSIVKSNDSPYNDSWPDIRSPHNSVLWAEERVSHPGKRQLNKTKGAQTK